MVRSQKPPESVVMLQPQPPPAYPPFDLCQSVPQGPYAQGPHPGQPADFVPNTPLPDYFCYSIFTMICCCTPLGVAAFVFSLSARNAERAGHRELAERNSKTARTLNNSALCLGIILIVVLIVYEIIIVTERH